MKLNNTITTLTTNDNSGGLANKKTKGRIKIEIKKIENLIHRKVTFSKWGTGLFKKASELCILTGAEVAILVQSLGNRVYSFGHPTLDSMIDRFLGAGAKCEEGGQNCPAPKTREYNRHYCDVCDELEQEKERKAVIDEAKKGGAYGSERFWWDEGLEGLDLEEPEHYAAALEELVKNITVRVDDLMLVQRSNFLPLPLPPPSPPAAEGLISMASTNAEAEFSLEDTAVMDQNEPTSNFENCIIPYGFGQWQL